MLTKMAPKKAFSAPASRAILTSSARSSPAVFGLRPPPRRCSAPRALPRTDMDLAYFEEGVRLLQRHPRALPDAKVGVIGTSMGGGIAMASHIRANK